MSWPSEYSSKLDARFQRLAISEASRRKPLGLASGPGVAMAER